MNDRDEHDGLPTDGSPNASRSYDALPSAKPSRWRVHVLWAGAVIAAVLLTAAGTALVARPYTKSASRAAPSATYVAKDGVLDLRVSTEATVTFLKGPPAVAPVPGTITSVGIKSDGVLRQGQQIYTIDLRPVFVAIGAVPAFRTMQRGERGPDVAQLRALLGLPRGQYFDTATTAAVRRWQSKNNISATGMVGFGDVIFLPELPTRGYFADGVIVGSHVSPGQTVVQTVQTRPEISVTDEGGTMGLRPGMHVTLLSSKAPVMGALGLPEAGGNDNGVAYPVVASDGRSPCDVTCASGFSITARSQTPVSVQTIPRTSGVLVPASALALLPNGASAVVDKRGVAVRVQVVIQANGLAIVTGLTSGTTIRLFAKVGIG